MRGLRPSLYGSFHPVEHTGIRALLATTYASRLVSLCLADVGRYAEDVEQLADPALAGLVDLDLTHTYRQTVEGLASLRLPRLARLDLSGTVVGDESVCTLAARTTTTKAPSNPPA